MANLGALTPAGAGVGAARGAEPAGPAGAGWEEAEAVPDGADPPCAGPEDTPGDAAAGEGAPARAPPPEGPAGGAGGAGVEALDPAAEPPPEAPADDPAPLEPPGGVGLDGPPPEPPGGAGLDGPPSEAPPGEPPGPPCPPPGPACPPPGPACLPPEPPAGGAAGGGWWLPAPPDGGGNNGAVKVAAGPPPHTRPGKPGWKDRGAVSWPCHNVVNSPPLTVVGAALGRPVGTTCTVPSKTVTLADAPCSTPKVVPFTPTITLGVITSNGPCRRSFNIWNRARPL